jgi:hypothetical protein
MTSAKRHRTDIATTKRGARHKRRFSVYVALGAGVGLIVVALVAAALLGPCGFLFVVALCLALTVSCGLWLNHQPVVDGSLACVPGPNADRRP